MVHSAKVRDLGGCGFVSRRNIELEEIYRYLVSYDVVVVSGVILIKNINRWFALQLYSFGVKK